MNVSLTAGLIAYIDARVDSGSFRSRSEVVRHALRILERKEPLRQASADPPAAPAAPPSRSDSDLARDPEIQRLIAPLRAARDRIQDVVREGHCASPRILIREVHVSPVPLWPGHVPNADGPVLTVELLVNAPGGPRLGVREEMEHILQHRVGILIDVEYDEPSRAGAAAQDRKGTIGILPL
jgi:Arc/MetJ-type ribon-helix-helix transcriptional regulator